MVDDFTASNGWYIENGGVYTASGVHVSYPTNVTHIRQLLQEERDHELGWWRDPVTPEYVVYQPEAGQGLIRVFNERETVCVDYSESSLGEHVRTPYRDVAERFFAAHPQHKPLPILSGKYVNRDQFLKSNANARVLICYGSLWVFEDDPSVNATQVAQSWNDAGELVRLVLE